MKVKFAFFLVVIFFYACSTTLKIKPLDEKTGKLPTDAKLANNEIIVDKSIGLDSFSHFLFIKKSTLNGISTYEKYIKGTLTNIGGFNKIYDQEELEKYVIQNNLADKVTSVSDNIGLFKLQKEVGKFLICETTIEHFNRYDFKFDLKIVNPENAEVLLEINHYAYNWAGLNKPLFNPVFNYYIDWLKKNKK